MRNTNVWFKLALLAACGSIMLLAQSVQKTVTGVPRLVQFGGTLTDGAGKPLTGVMGVTFSLYEKPEGGVAVWAETQNLEADVNGNYTVLLGATRNEGIPAEVFNSGRRWLSVQAQGQPERPRVLITSVPYSLKAVDAETLGGLPASAYVLAATAGGSSAGHDLSSPGSEPGKRAVSPETDVTGTGSPHYIPIWTGTSALGSSLIEQTDSGVLIKAQTTVSSGYTDVSGFPLVAASLQGGVYGAATDTAGAYYGVKGVSDSSTGAGVYGQAAGGGYGVYGSAATASGYGVYGENTAGSGYNFGVYGITGSYSGTGVKGVGVEVSTEGATADTGGVGVWGDSSLGAEGVLATADDTAALGAYSKSSSQATAFIRNDSTSQDSIVLSTYGGHFGGYCDAFSDGDLVCSGSVGGDAHINPSQDVALYSVQAADNWMEDAGSGRLQNGAALVHLDPVYAQTVNTGMEYHVFLTPKGDCKGLYVSEETAGSFEVHELGGGSSNIGFDYRIMARRKGLESIRLADMTGKIGPRGGEGRGTPARKREVLKRQPSPSEAASGGHR